MTHIFGSNMERADSPYKMSMIYNNGIQITGKMTPHKKNIVRLTGTYRWLTLKTSMMIDTTRTLE